MNHIIFRPVSKLALLCCLGLLAIFAVSLDRPRELRAQERKEVDFNFGDFENKPREELTPAQLAAVFVFYGVILAFSVAILVLICLGLSGFLKALPPEFRLMEPGLVWLILIPCFNIIWIFFVYQRIARSYQNFFRAHGRFDVGDCGEAIGLWYCLCVVLSVIPCVGIIASIAALILLVIYFVTLFGLKGQVRAYLAQPRFGAPMS
jgi:hypothetical protein